MFPIYELKIYVQFKSWTRKEGKNTYHHHLGSYLIQDDSNKTAMSTELDLDMTGNLVYFESILNDSAMLKGDKLKTYALINLDADINENNNETFEFANGYLKLRNLKENTNYSLRVYGFYVDV
jgi:hypothetical protein